ncbi:MAG: cobalamin-dependent protein [bacterium]
MKVLLISTNQATMPYYVTPIGLAYIAATLQHKGYEIDLLDICFEKDIHKSVQEKIVNFDPDIIGIGVRNDENATISPPQLFIPTVKEVVNECKKYKNIPIILGGGGFSNLPEEILRYCQVDVGIYGEGEYAFPEILRRIENNKEYYDTPGVASLRDGVFSINPPRFIENLDEIPFPARDLYDERYYTNCNDIGGKAIESILTKRGCIYRCIYCTDPYREGRKIRMRSPKNVVDEIEFLANERGVEMLEVVDNIFTTPAEHAREICEEIIRRKVRINWICPANPCGLTKELLMVMQKAGCCQLGLGIETASKEMLKIYKKGFDQESILKVTDWCKELGLEYNFFLLIGGPGEDYNTVKETLKVTERSAPTADPGVLANVGLRVWRGVEMFEMLKREGAMKEDEDLLSPKMYLSKGINAKVVELLQQYGDKYSNWFFVGSSLQDILEDSIKRVKRECVFISKELNVTVEIGSPFPEFSLPTVSSDEKISLQSFKGKVIVLVVGSRKSDTEAEKWAENTRHQFKNNGLFWVQQFASCPEKLPFFISKKFVRRMMKKGRAPDSMMTDWNRKVTPTLGITDDTIPHVFLIDKLGVLRYKVSGCFSHEKMDRLNKEIKNIL